MEHPVVDIDIEDDDEMEKSRTSKIAMKENERLKIPRWLKAMSERRVRKVPKKFQLMITFESKEKDDDESLPPMALMNLLSTTSAELVEFGREAMRHTSNQSPTSQPGERMSKD